MQGQRPLNPLPTPVANPDYYYVTENGTLNVSAANGLLLNDFDPDGDAVSVNTYYPTSHGVLSVFTTGSFIYTPDAGFVGTDTASYTMSDGTLSASANLVINVIGSPGLIQNLSLGTKGLTLDCPGYPGTTYDVQRATGRSVDHADDANVSDQWVVQFY